MDVGIDISDVQRYAAVMERASRAGPIAMSALLNNMAFGARRVALGHIPRVMHVRNKGFLAASVLVRKSTPSTLSATFYSAQRARFTGLYEQEFGGELQRHAATTAARGGTEKGTMRATARLRGDILSPEDIRVAHEKSWEQRVHVFLEMIQRENYRGPFVLHKSGKWKPGLKRIGKLVPGARTRRRRGKPAAVPRDTRQIVTLQTFDTKDKIKVEKRPWMWVSVQKYLSVVRLEVTWARTLEKLMAREGARRAAA